MSLTVTRLLKHTRNRLLQPSPPCKLILWKIQLLWCALLLITLCCHTYVSCSLKLKFSHEDMDSSPPPIHRAIYEQTLSLDRIRALISSQPSSLADVDRRTGHSPLHAAARRGQPALTRLLVEAGCYVDARSSNGQTPFMIACQVRSYLQCFQLSCSILLDLQFSYNYLTHQNSHTCTQKLNCISLTVL